MRVEELTIGGWADALPSSCPEVFHEPAALEAIDEYSEGDMRLFGGFKGQEPVALLPVFVREVALGRVVTSPPPGLGVPYLGPLLMPNSPKRRKRESINNAFVGDVLDGLDVDARGTVTRVVCPPTYPDPRPFVWSDLSVEPRFTYRVEVGDRDISDVMNTFSSSLRRDIRCGEESDVTIEVEGAAAARRVYDDLERRYTEQDEAFRVPQGFVESLATDLDDDRSRVYVARDGDGEYLSAIVVLFSHDAAYYWQGGVRAEHEGTSVNTLIHWRVLRDIVTDPALSSVSTYDLEGANTQRLCDYKAKFGGSLVPYYVVESNGPATTAAKKAFRLVGN